MKNRITAVLISLTGLAFVASCGRVNSPDSSLGSGTDAAGTVAASALDATNRDMQAADSLRHGPCGAFGFPIGVPNGCPYDASTQTFTCGPDLLPDGLTATHGYQFLDASHSPQAAYDSTTTASIHFTAHLSGTSKRDGRSHKVDDTRDIWESGLAGTETTRIWNGTGSSSRQDSVGANIITAVSTTTVADVVVPAPFERDSWPLSGTITTHLVVSDGTDVTSVIAFNGTRYVPLTVNGNTVTIDLAREHLGGGAIGPPPGGRRHGRH